jgi:cytochrome c-type protein NapB
MEMKKWLIGGLVASMVALTTSAWSQESNNGGISSLRGGVEVSDVNQAEHLKKPKKDTGLIELNYVMQPPLIPHKVRGYRIDLNSNKCLSCHSWKNAKANKATKISVTHFQTRDGQVLGDISPRRYFCTQCHVSQIAGEPLVESTFKAVKSLQ